MQITELKGEVLEMTFRQLIFGRFVPRDFVVQCLVRDEAQKILVTIEDPSRTEFMLKLRIKPAYS